MLENPAMEMENLEATMDVTPETTATEVANEVVVTESTSSFSFEKAAKIGGIVLAAAAAAYVLKRGYKWAKAQLEEAEEEATVVDTEAKVVNAETTETAETADAEEEDAK